MHSYTIHGIVDVKSDVPLHLPSYFSVSELDCEPDITVSVGDVEYDASEEHKVGAKYYWNPEERRLVVDWAKDALMWSNVRAAVSKLGRGHTTIEVTKWFYRFGDFIDVVLSVIRFRLLQQNAAIIHTAGLKPPNSDGLLIQGLSNMGKSSTSLPLAVNHNYGFLGDDSVIVHDDTVYCYPREIGVSPGTVVPSDILTSCQQAEHTIRKLFSNVPLSRAIPFLPDSNMRVSPEKITNVTEKTSVDRCYFLESSQGKNGVFHLDTSEGLRRMSANVLFEGDGAPVKVHHLLKTYSYLDTEFDSELLIDRYMQIVREFFRQLNLFEVRARKENIRQLIRTHISESDSF